MNSKILSWTLDKYMAVLKKEEAFTCFWLVDINIRLECSRKINGIDGKVELAYKFLNDYQGSMDFKSIHTLIFLLGMVDTSETALSGKRYSYQIISTRRLYFRVTGKNITDIPMHYVMESKGTVRKANYSLKSDITTVPIHTPCLSIAIWFEEIVKRRQKKLQIYELIRNFGINLSVKQGTIWIIKIVG